MSDHCKEKNDFFGFVFFLLVLFFSVFFFVFRPSSSLAVFWPDV